MNTTPRVITPQILSLCKKLDESQTPVFVPVKPAAGAIIDECYGNVEAHIAQHGGRLQHGWIIWEHPGVIIEGNFHACWADESGQFVDITPKQDREQTILFLPDTKRVYTGTPIDNVREILTNDPALARSLRMQEQFNKLRQKYNVDGRRADIPAYEFRRLGLPVPQSDFIDMTDRQANPGKVGRNDPCPCGSGIKYKKCCL